MYAKKHHTVTVLTRYSYVVPIHAMITDNKCSRYTKATMRLNLNTKYHEPKTDVLHPLFGV